MRFEGEEGGKEWGRGEEGGGRKRGNTAMMRLHSGFLRLLFSKRAAQQSVALLVTMLVRVDEQRDDQNDNHTNRNAEDGDHHYA